MAGGTHAQNPVIVQGNVSMPADAVPVLDIEQLREAVNFLRAGCPAVQLMAKHGWAGGPLGEKEQAEWFATWTDAHQAELEGFLDTAKLPDENFSIKSAAHAVKGKSLCIIVYTVTRKLAAV